MVEIVASYTSHLQHSNNNEEIRWTGRTSAVDGGSRGAPRGSTQDFAAPSSPLQCFNVVGACRQAALLRSQYFSCIRTNGAPFTGLPIDEFISPGFGGSLQSERTALRRWFRSCWQGSDRVDKTELRFDAGLDRESARKTVPFAKTVGRRHVGGRVCCRDRFDRSICLCSKADAKQHT